MTNNRCYINLFLLPKLHSRKLKKNWFANVDVPYLSLEEFGRTFHHFLITRLFSTHFTREEKHCPGLILNLTFQLNLFEYSNTIGMWFVIVVKFALSWSYKALKKHNIFWWFYQDVMCKLWAKTLKGPGILNFSAMWKLHKEPLLQNSKLIWYLLHWRYCADHFASFYV